MVANVWLADTLATFCLSGGASPMAWKRTVIFCVGGSSVVASVASAERASPGRVALLSTAEAVMLIGISEPASSPVAGESGVPGSEVGIGWCGLAKGCGGAVFDVWRYANCCRFGEPSLLGCGRVSSCDSDRISSSCGRGDEGILGLRL
jgi:hypothetical protein